MDARKLRRLVWVNLSWVQAAHKYNGRWAWYYVVRFGKGNVIVGTWNG